jgi:ATP-dependent protease Clp ATPase subunit
MSEMLLWLWKRHKTVALKKQNLFCTFCSKPQGEVYRLIASTPSICICNQCITDGWLILSDKPDYVPRDLQFEVSDSNIAPQLRCSFCHKPSRKVGRMISTTSNSAICEECLDACSLMLIQEEKQN